MKGLGDFLVSWAVSIKTFFLLMPEEIMFLGVIIGFLCASTGWQKNTLRINDFLYKLCNLSGILAVIICFAMGLYILLKISLLNLAYYVIAVLLGVIVCKAVHLIFNFFGRMGSFFDIILNILSGPGTLYVSWLFYTNELIREVKSLI